MIYIYIYIVLKRIVSRDFIPSVAKRYISTFYVISNIYVPSDINRDSVLSKAVC